MLDRAFEKNITLRYSIRTSLIVHAIAIVACIVGGVIGSPALAVAFGVIALVA